MLYTGWFIAMCRATAAETYWLPEIRKDLCNAIECGKSDIIYDIIYKYTRLYTAMVMGDRTPNTIDDISGFLQEFTKASSSSKPSESEIALSDMEMSRMFEFVQECLDNTDEEKELIPRRKLLPRMLLCKDEREFSSLIKVRDFKEAQNTLWEEFLKAKFDKDRPQGTSRKRYNARKRVKRAVLQPLIADLIDDVVEGLGESEVVEDLGESDRKRKRNHLYNKSSLRSDEKQKSVERPYTHQNDASRYAEKVEKQKKIILNSYLERIIAVFEYAMGKKLRSDQRTALEDIVSRLKESSVIYQKMMGGGKTTFIGPIISMYVTHELDLVPVFVFPASLLAQGIESLSGTLWSAFGKHLFRLQMERGDEFCSEEYLGFLLLELHRAQTARDAIVCRPEDIQCLQNSLKEALVELPQVRPSIKHVYETRVYLLTEILRFFKERGFFIIDEIDSVMSLTKSLNFNASEEAEHSVDDMSMLVDTLIGIYKKDKSYFNSSNKLSKQEQNTLMKITCDVLGERISTNMAERYYYRYILPLWDRQRNVGYGLPLITELPHVVPYKGANQPSEKSSFSDYLYTLGLSVKFYLEGNIDSLPVYFAAPTNRLLLAKLFMTTDCDSENLKNKINELKNGVAPDGSIDLSRFKDFIMKLVANEIVTYKHQYVSSAYEFIGSCKSFLGYSGTLFNEDVLRSIPHSPCIFDKEGVIIEEKIMASFSNKDEPEYPVCVSMNAADPFSSLKEMLLAQYRVVTTPNDKSSEPALKPFSAVIDIGAIFRDYPNDVVVDKILETGLYDCVIYFTSDEGNITWKLSDQYISTHARKDEIKNGKTPKIDLTDKHFERISRQLGVQPHRIVVYFAAKETVGANVIMSDRAAGCLATASPFMNKQRLFQGVMRPRLLLTGVGTKKQYRIKRQRITFMCLGIEARKEKLCFNDILRVCEENEDALVKKENSQIDRCRAFAQLCDHLLHSDIKMKKSHKLQGTRRAINDRAAAVNKHKWVLYSERPKNMKAKLNDKIFSGLSVTGDLELALSSAGLLDMTVEVQSQSMQERQNQMEGFDFGKQYTPEKEHPYTGEVVTRNVDGIKATMTRNFAKTAKEIDGYSQTLSKAPVLFDRNNAAITLNEANKIMEDPNGLVWSPYLLKYYDKDVCDDAAKLSEILKFAGLYYPGTCERHPDCSKDITETLRKEVKMEDAGYLFHSESILATLLEACRRLIKDPVERELLWRQSTRWDNMNARIMYLKDEYELRK